MLSRDQPGWAHGIDIPKLDRGRWQTPLYVSVPSFYDRHHDALYGDTGVPLVVGLFGYGIVRLTFLDGEDLAVEALPVRIAPGVGGVVVMPAILVVPLYNDAANWRKNLAYALHMCAAALFRNAKTVSIPTYSYID